MDGPRGRQRLALRVACVYMVEAATGRLLVWYNLQNEQRAWGASERVSLDELRGNVTWAMLHEHSRKLVEGTAAE